MGSALAWRRATGERETCWCKRGVSLVCGMLGGIHILASIDRRCGEITSVMSQCHAYLRGLGESAFACAALVESAFAWRGAAGEREACWCKRGVALVSGMNGGIV